MDETRDTTPFGRLLRRRRTQRNVTQERLAYRADLSPRHVSFLETGRSNPSRASALALARALDLPLRDRNALLRAGGFAPAYPERDPVASDDSHLRSLFSFLLGRHEPFPAYVVDRAWTVRLHNRAAARLLAWLLDRHGPVDARDGESGDAGPRKPGPLAAPAGAGGGPATGEAEEEPGPHGHEAGEGTAEGASRRLAGTNLLRLLFDPEGLRPLTVNFDAVGRYLLDRLEEALALQPEDEELAGLRRELEELGPLPGPGAAVRAFGVAPPGEAGPAPGGGGMEAGDDGGREAVTAALPVHLRKDGVDLRLLSFLMTVAAPRDVGLEETRMETFLPADGETEAFLRELSST